MGKKTAIAICVLLLAYFVFTSGIVFEMRGDTDLSITDIPYSIVMSGERTGLLGIFISDDVACGKWLGKTKDTLILADYNGINLVSDYVAGYDRISPQNIYDIRLYWKVLKKTPHYLLLTTWNIENQKMVVGISPALRMYDKLPDLTGAVEVFRSGKSVVYYYEAG